MPLLLRLEPRRHTVPRNGPGHNVGSRCGTNWREEPPAQRGPAATAHGGEGVGLSSRPIPAMSLQALLFLSCKRTVLQAFCRHQRIPIRMSGVPGSTATDPPGDRGGLSQSPQNPGLRTALTAAALLPAPPPTVPTLASLPLLLLCSRLPWPPVPRAEPPLPAQTYTWDKTSNVTRK